MNGSNLVCSALLSALVACGPAAACGEGQFNMGHGLRYQGYMAPRPATVLIYSGADESLATRERLAKALQASGHTVTAVDDAEAMAVALRSKQYDVLIADYALIDVAVTSAQASGRGAPAMLPIVDRRQRNDAGLRQRFANFVLDGASLGQFLKSINRSLPVASR